MKEIFLRIKKLFAGKWQGEGFAKYPTIDNTAYTEQLKFIPDEFKDAILIKQKTWYKNNTEKNGQTVFWDTGFILLKEDKVLLHSTQVGGRIEKYLLTNATSNTFTFISAAILNDVKTIKSQRIFTVDDENLHYELNMTTCDANFQNHLSAHLKKIDSYKI